MKKFLLRSIAFVVFSAVIIGAFHVILMTKKASWLRLPDDVHTVFMGNSTIETSVNDTIVPHSMNMAKSADNVEFVYLKLKMLKRFNPQLDTLIVGLDDIILFKGDIDWTGYGINHPFYFSEFDLDDHISNLRHFKMRWNQRYITSLYDGMKWYPLLIKKGGSPNDLQIGRYLYLERDKLQKDIDENSKKYSTKYNPDEISEGVLHYFHKIISFCERNDITLIFITTPKHKEYWGRNAFREIHRRHFPNVPLYDYTEIAYPDSCYGDVVHLNNRGARIFSGQLSKGFDSVHSTVATMEEKMLQGTLINKR